MPHTMSNAELFRSQSETSTLPSVLATVISLGLHGLLWAAPISMSKQKSDTQRTVELVQLTPAEMSRLAEFSDPSLSQSLPPLPPPLPSTDVPPPPIEQPSTFALQQQEELVRQRLIKRQEELLRQQLQRQEELLRQEQLQQRQKLRQEQEQRQETSTKQQEQEKQRQQQLQRQQLEQQKQQQESRRQLEQQKQQDELRRQVESQEQEKLRRRLEIEVLDQLQQQNKLLAQVEKQWQRQQKLQALKSIYGGYNLDNTTKEASNNNLMSFYQIIQQFAGEQKNWNSEKISIRFESPIKYKLPPDVTPAGVALLIDSDGKLLTDPMLTRSTGYPVLNQAAIEAAKVDVKKQELPPPGEKKIYLYEIEIDQNSTASF